MPKPRVDRERMTIKGIAESMARERSDLEPTDYLHLIMIQRLGQAIHTFDERYFRKHFNMSGADMRILFALRRAGPPYAMRPTQLFHSLLITSGTLAKQVARLQAAGLVNKHPGPKKSGGSLVGLTPHGFEVANDGMSRLGVWSKELLPSLDRSERATLCVLADKLISDIESYFSKEESDG